MHIFVKFWHFLTMPAHQIWSCQVTQEANFETFLSCPNSAFNIRKSHKISSRKALYFRSYQPKTSRGGWGGGGKHNTVSEYCGWGHMVTQLKDLATPITYVFRQTIDNCKKLSRVLTELYCFEYLFW